MKQTLRIIVPLFLAVFIPFVFWCSGYDFNERGYTAVMCAMLTVLAPALSFACIQDCMEDPKPDQEKLERAMNSIRERALSIAISQMDTHHDTATGKLKKS
jgi:hypothetical protein